MVVKRNRRKLSARALTRSVPPHLDDSTWLDFEQKTALTVYDSLARSLKRLCSEANVPRVHEARVVLRRFDSIWKVLKEDGWESKKFKRSVGNDLKEVRRMLGKLRDWDVNLELARSFDLPQDLIDSWQVERDLLAQSITSELDSWDIKRFLKDLRSFLKKRPKKIAKRAKKAGLDLKESAYLHLEPYLLSQEVLSQDLARKAKTAEELHQLRLSIKSWRYVLTEFFGLTNLELVRAQQILGKLNDLARLSKLVGDSAAESPLANESLSKLSQQSKKLLADFTEFRNNLPFGLRPSIASVAKEN